MSIRKLYSACILDGRLHFCNDGTLQYWYTGVSVTLCEQRSYVTSSINHNSVMKASHSTLMPYSTTILGPGPDAVSRLDAMRCEDRLQIRNIADKSVASGRLPLGPSYRYGRLPGKDVGTRDALYMDVRHPRAGEYDNRTTA